MITENKYCKLAFKIVSLLCIMAVIICFICDFVINRQITWSAIVLASVTFGWLLVSTVLLAAKNKIVFFLCALTISVIPFLFALEKTVPYSTWFFPLALPIGIVSILVIWISFVVIKFLKINYWYKSAIFVFLYAVIMFGNIAYFSSIFYDDKFIKIAAFIDIVSALVIVFLLTIIGHHGIKIEKFNFGKKKKIIETKND